MQLYFPFRHHEVLTTSDSTLLKSYVNEIVTLLMVLKASVSLL
jgi:hypothetical protein